MRFVPLAVTEVAPETRDAVRVTLRAPEGFDFEPGQYLTLRHEQGGVELRRSYSICAGAGEPLAIGVKRVEGGAFSTHAQGLAPGDVVHAMPPMGRFARGIDLAAPGHLLLVAAGSGITPILSILRTALARGPARVTLLYANRNARSIMFRSAIEDLKDRHMDRLSVLHVLSEGTDMDLFSGRIDAARMEALLGRWIDTALDAAFICGPRPMMETVAVALGAHLPTERIRYELFAAGQPGRAPVRAPAASGDACAVSVTLDGATHRFAMALDGTAVLDAALADEIEAPYACKAGVCSTCRAKVTEGEAEMRANHALEDYEVRAGYVLTCQCLPLTRTLALTYDA